MNFPTTKQVIVDDHSLRISKPKSFSCTQVLPKQNQFTSLVAIVDQLKTTHLFQTNSQGRTFLSVYTQFVVVITNRNNVFCIQSTNQSIECRGLRIYILINKIIGKKQSIWLKKLDCGLTLALNFLRSSQEPIFNIKFSQGVAFSRNNKAQLENSNLLHQFLNWLTSTLELQQINIFLSTFSQKLECQ